MGAGAALGSPVPSGEGAGRPRGLSLLASWESTRRRCIPAWPRCQQSPVPSRTVAAGRSALARRATSRLRRPECCTAQAVRLPWQCSSQVLEGRAQLTSFRTRFGGAPPSPSNGLPEGVPWVDVL